MNKKDVVEEFAEKLKNAVIATMILWTESGIDMCLLKKLTNY
nr:MAG TPA: hypothetical protein [Caudoviricetes sp.]